MQVSTNIPAIIALMAVFYLTSCKKEEAPPEPPAPELVDIDGHVYSVVQIGTQRWMAENLRTSKYRDGSVILNLTDNTSWDLLDVGGWCYYENNAAHGATYGKLYNWNAASHPGICPQGWHVPSDAEWQQMQLVLGMPTSEVDSTGIRGGLQNVGGKMKSTTLWTAPNVGANNESGFSGLPSGGRANIGSDFFGINIVSEWWSSTEAPTWGTAWSYGLHRGSAGSYRGDEGKKSGKCIRCIKD